MKNVCLCLRVIRVSVSNRTLPPPMWREEKEKEAQNDKKDTANQGKKK